MTALKKYERLESTGLWRAGADQQRREVTVSFGDTSLVIADSAERPMAHWSLPAIERINPGERPAIFAPDDESSETLEIEDAIMIDAVEQVRKYIARRRPRPGRLRFLGVALSIGTVAALSFFWLPGALTRHTLSVVPASTRSEIGATLLGHMQRLTGPACRDPIGIQALAGLKTRLLGAESRAQIIVIPESIAPVRILPGGVIVVAKTLIEDFEDPEVVAGHILAQIALTDGADLLAPVLETGGLAATVRLLTTGILPNATLAAHAETLVTAAVETPETDQLLRLFQASGISSAPYAYSIDITGESTLDLIEADPIGDGNSTSLLSDRDWVALQGICGG